MTDPDPHAPPASDDDHVEPMTSGRSELPPLRDYNGFACFEDEDTARQTLLTLERKGIDGHELSALLLTGDTSPGGDRASERIAAEHEDVATVKQVGIEGAKGGVLGAALGAVGGAAVAVAIPGVGLALGAGAFAAAAGGGAAGAGVGSLVGAMSHTPASRSWQRALVDINGGDIVVGVHTDDRETFDTAVEVLESAGAAMVRQVDRDGEPLR